MPASNDRKSAFDQMIQDDPRTQPTQRKGFGSGSAKRERLKEDVPGEAGIPPIVVPAVESEAPRSEPRDRAGQVEEEGGYRTPNYHGNSIYEKADGRVVKKVGVELRLDQVEALERAVSSGKVGRPDARGRDRGEIIRKLLDEAGYNASYRAPNQRW